MVKNSVLGASHCKVDHVVPFGVVTKTSSYH
jgi:hypothetical protein